MSSELLREEFAALNAQLPEGQRCLYIITAPAGEVGGLDRYGFPGGIVLVGAEAAIAYVRGLLWEKGRPTED